METTITDKFIRFFKLFFPLLFTQAALIGTSVCSTIFSGLAGTDDLAGVAIGSNLWIPLYTGMLGIFLGITPILSQLLGAEKKENIGTIILQSIYLAIAFGIVIILLGSICVQPLLAYMNLAPKVEYVALHYLKAIAWGVIPIFIFTTLRNVIDSHSKAPISMAILVINFFITLALFNVFIFGEMGAPALGGIGTGYAISVASWITCAIFLLVLWFKKPFSHYNIFRNLTLPSWHYWYEQLRIGFPIGAAIFCEVSIFSIVTLLMSQYGTAIIAAHQAATSFATFIYIVPLSVGLCATILVGFEVGAQRYRAARQYAFICSGFSLFAALLIGVYCFTHAYDIARVFTKDDDIATTIISFIAYAVFFIITDAIGTPAQGILRGYKDVKSISFIAVVSYWVVSLPVGFLLAQYTDMKPYGYWLGLIIGLLVAGITYNIRLVMIQRNYPKQ